MAEKLLTDIPRDDGDNIGLHALENSDMYSSMEDSIRRILLEQWEDVVYSGIINEVYAKYLDFFQNPEGKDIRIRKATTIEDVEEVQEETQQEDRVIVGIDYLDVAALGLFLTVLVDKKIKPISSYYQSKTKFTDYLKWVGNKAGQEIINSIPTKREYTFRISDKVIKDKIADRVDYLITTLDDTTKKRLKTQLLNGIKRGDTKTQMIERLQKSGADISRLRAKQIILTETAAINEYIRYQTALKNGVSTVVWHTVMDERTCPLCGPLNGQTKTISTNFSITDKETETSFSGMYPPVHPSCRCWLEYVVQTNLAEDFVRLVTNNDNLEKKINRLETMYIDTDRDEPFRVVNPDAIWLGGSVIVGPDRKVGEYRERLMSMYEYKQKIKAAIAKDSEGVMLLDTKDFIPLTTTEDILVEARKDLSDGGFVQLLHSLGFRRTILAKKFN